MQSKKFFAIKSTFFIVSQITLRLSYSNRPRNNHIEIARNINLNQHNHSLTAQSGGLVGFEDNLYAR